MNLRKKTSLTLLCLLFLVAGHMGVSLLWADPLETLGPDQSLYQRVRNLGHAGLLEEKDRATLDAGEPVTRLQLAFYVQKARTRLQTVPPFTPVPKVTEAPTLEETPLPTVVTPKPTIAPKKTQTVVTPQPTTAPKKTAVPKAAPVKAVVTKAPTVEPTPLPTEAPTEVVTAAPTAEAVSPEPTVEVIPTEVVIEETTPEPTALPTEVVTEAPTAEATPSPETPVATPQAQAADLIEPPPAAMDARETTPTYIWQEGDDMKSVAKKVYGSEAMAGFLQDANKDLMDQPDALKAGRVIKTPPARAVVPSTQPDTSVPALTGDALKSEVESLLKELREEDAALKARLLKDQRLAARQVAGLDKMKPVLEQWDRLYRKSDRSSGGNHMDIESNARFENIQLSGVTQVNAFRSVEEVKIGLYVDLGGRGTMNTGFGGVLPMTNATAGEASVSIYAPKINYTLDGRLGHWENNLTIEDYLGDTDLGTFARGVDGSNRFERPFEVKNYSSDKNQRCWDDYINNLGYVASVQTFSSGSSSSRVFDGLLMKGSRVPYIGKDSRLTLLFGPTSTTRRWEEGMKFSRSWFRGKVNTNLSTLWLNDHYGYGAPVTAKLDSKTYMAEVALGALPVFIDLEMAASSLKTGVDTQTVGEVQPVWGKALQATMSYYPFNLYVDVIDPEFSNQQSKVVIAGMDYNRFGFTETNDKFGYVGLSDSLVSGRRGGRLNLGWKGRQSAWMKGWPAFLDAFVINADGAWHREDRSLMDPTLGQHCLVVDQLVRVYTPDDTGLWGRSIWGGYAGLHPAGSLFFQNLDGARTFTGRQSVGMGTTEWVPLILPQRDSAGAPVTNSLGKIQYVALSHQKSYRHITGTVKSQINKLLGVSRPIYGGFFYSENRVSGRTSDPSVSAMADPNRPGETLAKVPDLFTQRVMDAAIMVRTLPNVNVMGDVGLERWRSDYTYPRMDRTIKTWGAGLAYDFPWGGGKFEARYKRLKFEDATLPGNDYVVDQTYAMFLFRF